MKNLEDKIKIKKKSVLILKTPATNKRRLNLKMIFMITFSKPYDKIQRYDNIRQRLNIVAILTNRK